VLNNQIEGSAMFVMNPLRTYRYNSINRSGIRKVQETTHIMITITPNSKEITKNRILVATEQPDRTKYILFFIEQFR